MRPHVAPSAEPNPHQRDVRGLRLLVVEDNPGDVDRVRARIADANEDPLPDVTVAECLGAALRELAADSFDAVLLDLGLPDAGGLEGLWQISRQVPDLPVVILTGLVDENMARRALSAGAEEYVVKDTMSGWLLMRTVRHAIERARVRAELAAHAAALESANARLEQLALVDPLTELLNRRGLERALAREIRWFERGDSEMLVVLADIDDFKSVNDRFGHAGGDLVLREVAGVLRGTLRLTDYVGRIGGDEFLMLLPQTRLVEGLQVAEKLRTTIAATVLPIAEAQARITASFGIAEVPAGTFSIEELVVGTQLGLRQSKTSGKNRVTLDEARRAAPSPRAPHSPRFEGERMVALEQLRRGEGFRAVRQPIVRLEDGAVVGYEYLSRSSVPPLELPDEFFRAALAMHMVSSLDRQCVRHCVAAASSSEPRMRCHFNVHPETVLDLSVRDLVAMLPHDRPADLVALELSDRQITGDPAPLADRVRALKDHGFRIVVEDLGLDRSSLEGLIVLEPQMVKVDRRFVGGLAADPAKQRFLGRFMNVARALGAEVVAEGVERADDLAALADQGVPYAQGFLWGTPS